MGHINDFAQPNSKYIGGQIPGQNLWPMGIGSRRDPCFMASSNLYIMAGFYITQCKTTKQDFDHCSYDCGDRNSCTVIDIRMCFTILKFNITPEK